MTFDRFRIFALFAAVVSASALACGGSEVASESMGGTATGDDELNALPGAFQARFRSTTGEDIVLAFDKVTRSLEGRPECRVTVARPLRIAVSKGSGLDAKVGAVTVDNYMRGKSVAFGKVGELSRSTSLATRSRVSVGGEIPELEIARTCSGETLELHQNLTFEVDGRKLIDPIGSKDNFWTSLGTAPKTGISPEARSELTVRTAEGDEASLTFGKLAGDDPKQPETCTQVSAVPAQLTLKVYGGSAVEATLTNTMRSATVAATTAPSSPGKLTLVKASGTTCSAADPCVFTAQIPPMVIASSCSGVETSYYQQLAISVDGKPRSALNLELSKSP